MASRMTRQQAREQALRAFQVSLDEMIPADESKPLKGRRFGDWEDQADQLVRKVVPVVLEGRGALEETAWVDRAGRCPRCESANTYLEKEPVRQKRHGPHGSTEVLVQQARCRDCDGSFSPSGSRLGLALGSAADKPWGQADGPRSGDPGRCIRSQGDQRGLGQRV
jgi:predicted Zn-ribbon and HTH transcriptional regulator